MSKNQIQWLIGIIAGIIILCVLDSYFKPTKPIENIRNRTSEIVDSLKVEQDTKLAQLSDSLSHYYLSKVDSIKKIKSKAKTSYITIIADTSKACTEKLDTCKMYVDILEAESEDKDSAIIYLARGKREQDTIITTQSHMILSMKENNKILFSDNQKLKARQRPPLWKEITNYAVISSASILAGILLSPYR